MQHVMIAIENMLYRIDLIGWLDFLQGIGRHGKLRKIAWYDTGGFQIENIIRRYKIHAYGRALQAELRRNADGKQRKVFLRWMWVNAKQAAWAEYCLLRGGIALVTVIDPRNVERAAAYNGALPPPWSGRRRAGASTPVEAAVDVFGAMLGLGEDTPAFSSRRDNRRAARQAGRQRARRGRS